MTRALVLVALIAGCRLTPPVATAADAERGQIALGELHQGRKLMIRKCGSCHRPPMPNEHTAAQWPVMMEEMSVRSNLDGLQRRLIQQYFVVMAPR